MIKKVKINYTKELPEPRKFRDSKPQPKKRFGKLSYLVLLILLFLGTFLVSYSFLEAKKDGVTIRQNVEQKVINSVKTVNQVWKPNIKTFEDRYVSVLIVAIDARHPVIENGSIRDSKTGYDEINTDTIIQVIYDMEKKNTFFISIPRDLGVEYSNEDPCLKDLEDYHERRSINHIYKLAEMGECDEGGIGMLGKYVEKVTGFPVNYHAIITMESFADVIEAVGEENEKGIKGLMIDIPEPVYSYYPNDKLGYNEYVYFKEGSQFLSTEDLLKYARVRSGSSDFERVRRQQIVMDALKERLSSVDTYKNPTKVVDLLDALKGSVVHSEFGVDEIRSSVEMYDSIKASKVYRIVLDNKLNGLNKLMTIPSYSNTGIHNVPRYYLIPISWNDPDYKQDKYKDVKEYIREYTHNPENLKEVE